MRVLDLQPHIGDSRILDSQADLGKSEHSVIDRRFLSGEQKFPHKYAGLSSCKRIAAQKRNVTFSKLALFEVSLQRSSVRSVTSSKVAASNSVIVPVDLALPKDVSSPNTTSIDVDFRRTKDFGLGNSAPTNFQAPFPISNRRNSYTLGPIDSRNERNARRRLKERGPSLPLSQGSNYHGGGMFMSTVGAMGPSVTRMGRIQGPIGLFMALMVAFIAISTATKRRLFSSPDRHQKPCSKCDGSGLRLCSICKGCGRVEWEGKLRHFDPCPLCFGSCYEKCSACSGIRVKNVGSFNLQQFFRNMKGKRNK